MIQKIIVEHYLDLDFRIRIIIRLYNKNGVNRISY
nr:MAG TPA: hypothetical protein [Caudoviricetes sp.]